MQTKLEDLGLLLLALASTWALVIRMFGVWQVALFFGSPFMILEVICYLVTLIGDHKCSKK